MSTKKFIGITALVGIGFGAVLILAPALLLGLNGVQTDAAGLLVARLLGVELIGLNIATWLCRGSETPQAQKFVVMAHVFSENAGFITVIAGILSGIGNAMLWSIAFVYVVFGMGYLYILLTEFHHAKAGHHSVQAARA